MGDFSFNVCAEDNVRGTAVNLFDRVGGGGGVWQEQYSKRTIVLLFIHTIVL